MHPTFSALGRMNKLLPLSLNKNVVAYTNLFNRSCKLLLFHLAKKSLYHQSYLLVMGFKSKMTTVDEMYLRVRQITSKCQCASRYKRRIILTPYGKQWRLIFTKIGLKFRIHFYIVLIVENKVTLYFVFSRSLHVRNIKCITIGTYFTRLCTTSILSNDGSWSEGTLVLLTKLLCRMCPIFCASVPFLSKSFFIYIAILRNDSRDAFGMPKCNSKTDRSTIIKNIHGELLKSARVCECRYYMSQMIKSVSKFFTVGHG